jgi:hypothetical protein
MDPAFSSNVDQQVMAAFTANYKRVYGKHSTYRADVDVERITREYHEAEALKRVKPPVVREQEPPKAATTSSSRELQALKAMNVGPRHAPAQRFSQPVTSSMDIGWGVDKLSISGTTAKKH